MSNWKNTGKRGLALFMALLMSLNLLSLPALAAEEDPKITAAKETLASAQIELETAKDEYLTKQAAYNDAYSEWEAMQDEPTPEDSKETAPDVSEEEISLLDQVRDEARAAMEKAKAAMDEAEARVEAAQAELDRLLAEQERQDADQADGEDMEIQTAPMGVFTAQNTAVDGDYEYILDSDGIDVGSVYAIITKRSGTTPNIDLALCYNGEGETTSQLRQAEGAFSIAESGGVTKLNFRGEDLSNVQLWEAVRVGENGIGFKSCAGEKYLDLSHTTDGAEGATNKKIYVSNEAQALKITGSNGIYTLGQENGGYINVSSDTLHYWNTGIGIRFFKQTSVQPEQPEQPERTLEEAVADTTTDVHYLTGIPTGGNGWVGSVNEAKAVELLAPAVTRNITTSTTIALTGSITSGNQYIIRGANFTNGTKCDMHISAPNTNQCGAGGVTTVKCMEHLFTFTVQDDGTYKISNGSNYLTTDTTTVNDRPHFLFNATGSKFGVTSVEDQTGSYYIWWETTKDVEPEQPSVPERVTGERQYELVTGRTLESGYYVLRSWPKGGQNAPVATIRCEDNASAVSECKDITIGDGTLNMAGGHDDQHVWLVLKTENGYTLQSMSAGRMYLNHAEDTSTSTNLPVSDTPATFQITYGAKDGASGAAVENAFTVSWDNNGSPRYINHSGEFWHGFDGWGIGIAFYKEVNKPAGPVEPGWPPAAGSNDYTPAQAAADGKTVKYLNFWGGTNSSRGWGVTGVADDTTKIHLYSAAGAQTSSAVTLDTDGIGAGNYVIVFGPSSTKPAVMHRSDSATNQCSGAPTTVSDILHLFTFAAAAGDAHTNAFTIRAQNDATKYLSLDASGSQRLFKSGSTTFYVTPTDTEGAYYLWVALDPVDYSGLVSAQTQFSGTTTGEPFSTTDVGTQMFRIPAIITLDNGWLVAAADVRWAGWNDNPANLDTIVSISKDGGTTWEWEVVNYFGDYANSVQGIPLSAAFIDPVLVQDPATDKVWLAIDVTAADGKSTGGSTGYDSQNRILVTHAPSYVGVKAPTDPRSYTYYVDNVAASVTFEGKTLYAIKASSNNAESGYAVDAFMNLYKVTDGAATQEWCKQEGSELKVQTNLFYKQSAWKVFPTCFIMLRSATVDETNGKLVWDDPTFPNLRYSGQTQPFFGVCPGRGFVTDSGRLLFPTYDNATGEKTSVIYSDDNGATWQRGNRSVISYGGKTSESQIIRLPDGTLRMYSRNSGGNRNASYADSTDGGVTWSATQADTGLQHGSNCMYSVINVNGVLTGPNGQRYENVVMASYPEGNGGASEWGNRSNGSLRIGYISGEAGNWTVNWLGEPKLYHGEAGTYFAYSCLTQFGAEDSVVEKFAVLYEPNDNASSRPSLPVDILYMEFDVAYVLGEGWSLTASEPEQGLRVTDAAGAVIDAVDGVYTIPTGGKVYVDGVLKAAIPAGVTSVTVSEDAAKTLTVGENGAMSLSGEGNVITLPDNTTTKSVTMAGAVNGAAAYAVTGEGKLVVSGTEFSGSYYGANGNYKTPWFAQKDQITELVVAEGMTRISAYYAFTGMDHLTSATLPDSLTYLQQNAFQNCTALASIEIPARVTDLQAYTFEGCTALTAVILPDTLTTIRAQAFKGCTSLTTIGTNENVVAIPDSVTEIYGNALENCTAITSVILPDTDVFSAREGGFTYSSVFRGCSGMTDVLIPEGTIKIPGETFKGCTSLKHVRIPSTVTEIGANAFMGCTALQSVTFPDGLNISKPNDYNASTRPFWGANPVAAIYEGNVSSGKMLLNFSQEKRVRYMTQAGYDKALASGLNDYAYNAVLDGGSIPADATFEAGKLITPIKAGYTFQGWYNGDTPLDKDAEGDTYTIPEDAAAGTTYTARWATYSVVTADDKTIAAENGTYTIPAGGKVMLGTEIHFTVPMGVKEIRVPADKAGELALGETNGEVAAIEGMTIVMPNGDEADELIGSGQCGDNVYYALIKDESWTARWNYTRMHVSGDGPMWDFVTTSYADDEMERPYKSLASNVKWVKVYNGVTSIGNCAFFNSNLSKGIELPDNGMLARIGEEAFHGAALPELNVPKGVKEIGKNAFWGAGSSAPDKTFMVTLPNTLTNLATYAFAYSNVTHISIPGSVGAIPEYAFKDCQKLQKVAIAEGITEIKASAFACSNGYRGEVRITLPDTLTSIGDKAFNNYKVQQLTIPASVQTIGSDVFHGGLYWLNFEGTPKNIAEDAFKQELKIALNTGAVVNIAVIYVDSTETLAKLQGAGIHGRYVFGNLNGHTIRPYWKGSVAILEEPFNANGTAAVWYTADGTALETKPHPNDSSKPGRTEIPNGVDATPGSVFTAGKLEEPITVVTANNETIAAENGIYTIPAGGKVMRGDETLFTTPMGVTSISVPEAKVEEIALGEGGEVEAIDGMTIALPDGTTTTSLSKSGSCGKTENDAVYFVNTAENKVVISGSGEMADYSSASHNTFGYTASQAVVMPGVTSVGAYAFAGNGVSLSKGVTLPDGLLKIGTHAFDGCGFLSFISIPNSVTTIEAEAFKDCSALERIDFPTGMTEVPANLFGSGIPSHLYRVTFAGDVASIGSKAFFKGTGSYSDLGTIVFQNSPTDVHANAFYTKTNSSQQGYGLAEGAVIYTQGAPSASMKAAATNGKAYLADLNGCTIPEDVISGLESNTLPGTLPVPEGAVFKGWLASSDGQLVTAKNQWDPGKLDISGYPKGTVFTAEWGVYHTVIVDGTAYTVKQGDKLSTVLPEKDPTKEGYIFQGWFNGETAVTAETEVTGTMTIMSKWQVNSYTVIVNGTAYNMTYGEELGDKLPTNMTKPGHTFRGWFNNGVEVNADTTVIGEMTIEPRWDINTYTVTVDGVNRKVEYNTPLKDLLDAITPTTDEEGVHFVKWVDGGGNEIAEDAVVIGDMTVIAVWAKDEYIVTVDGTEHTVEHGNTLSSILPTNPTRSGYTFQGWFNSEVEVNSETVVTGAMTITPKWEAVQSSYTPSVTRYTLTINYVDESGNTVAPTHTQSLTSGSSYNVTSPAVEGMTPDQTAVTGRLTGSLTVTVTYTADTNINETDVPLAELPLPFEDVKDGDWYREAVAYVWSKDLMVGTSDKIFGVNTNTTRGMMATMLYRLEKEPDTTFKSVFDDVDNGKWFSLAVTWANANSVVLGYGNGNFGPEDDVTREQLVTMLYRYSSMKGLDVSKRADLGKFADADKVSGYAKDAMSWAVAEGLVVGRGANNLAPDAMALRVEVAALFQRFMERYIPAETIV